MSKIKHFEKMQVNQLADVRRVDSINNGVLGTAVLGNCDLQIGSGLTM